MMAAHTCGAPAFHCACTVGCTVCCPRSPTQPEQANCDVQTRFKRTRFFTNCSTHMVQGGATGTLFSMRVGVYPRTFDANDPRGVVHELVSWSHLRTAMPRTAIEGITCAAPTESWAALSRSACRTEHTHTHSSEAIAVAIRKQRRRQRDCFRTWVWRSHRK